MKSVVSGIFKLITLITFGVMAAIPAAAHCDSMNGPVVAAARQALASGDVTPVLKWVQPQHEAEVRDGFARTLKIRKQNAESRELADRYFFETVVRLHRSGEGEPYTGLKTSEIEPGIAAADRALESGELDALVRDVSRQVAEGIRERFARVQQSQKRASQSVAAGREYVEAYVQYIHHMEKLHELAGGAATHGSAEAHRE